MIYKPKPEDYEECRKLKCKMLVDMGRGRIGCDYVSIVIGCPRLKEADR